MEYDEKEAELRKKIEAEIRAEYEREQKLREKIEAEIRAEYDKKLREIVTEICSEFYKNHGGQTEENKNFEISDGVLSKYKGYDETVVIPQGVTRIGRNAFKGNESLTNVTIPDSVTSIGAEAFSCCRVLASITIPSSITSVEEKAFWYCRSLTSITIGNSVTSITIGNSVTSIEKGAFRDCSSLTSITIPDSVTSIGSGAFFDCSSLTSIKFNGTKAQWKAISKDRWWNSDAGNYTVTCTDGTLTKSESEQ